MPNQKFEIIVVNDCSKDKTTEKGLDFVMYPNQFAMESDLAKEVGGRALRDIDLKVVEYPKNKGKGGAVRLGMMVASGDYALMVDADGATRFSDIEILLAKVKQIEKKLSPHKRKL